MRERESARERERERERERVRMRDGEKVANIIELKKIEKDDF